MQLGLGPSSAVRVVPAAKANYSSHSNRPRLLQHDALLVGCALSARVDALANVVGIDSNGGLERYINHNVMGPRLHRSPVVLTIIRELLRVFYITHNNYIAYICSSCNLQLNFVGHSAKNKWILFFYKSFCLTVLKILKYWFSHLVRVFSAAAEPLVVGWKCQLRVALITILFKHVLNSGSQDKPPEKKKQVCFIRTAQLY